MGKYSMILATVLVFSVIIYSYALRNSFLDATAREAESYNYNQAQNLAQSALMVTLNEIRDNPASSLIPGTNETTYYPSADEFQEWVEMNGGYRVRLENQEDTLLILESVGRSGGVTYDVSAGFSSENEWIVDIKQAVHAGDYMDLSEGPFIDGDVTLNSTDENAFRISGGADAITGTLSLMVGADPDVVTETPDWEDIDDFVVGGVAPMAQEQHFPMPVFPSFPAIGSELESVIRNSPGSPLHASHFDGEYIPELTLRSDATLNINMQGENAVLYVGRLNLEQGHLEVTGDGELDIYVIDEVNLQGDSSVNCGSDPDNCLSSGNSDADIFMYYHGDQPIDFSGGTAFNGGMYARSANVTLGGGNALTGSLITGGSSVMISGGAEAHSRVIYAPESDVTLTQGGILRGSVISRTFTAKGGAEVLYDPDNDEDLPDLPVETGSSYDFVYWY